MITQVQNFLYNTFKKFHRKDAFLLIISILIGISVGLASVGLKHFIEFFLSSFFKTKGETLLGILPSLPFYFILLIPALGGILVGVLKFHLFRSGAVGGVEQVMRSLAVKQGYLSKKEVFEKFITSAITLGSGGSAGKEGPVVHIGGGIGSVIGRLFRMPHEYVKALVGAGAAAGIAGAFNAPIAGTFFAMEILLGDISLNIVSMIIVAAISATLVGRFFLGEHPAFSPPIYEVSSPMEFLFYIVLGILAGYVCIIFIRSLVLSKTFFQKISIPDFIKPGLGGLMVGMIALLIPNILGIGYGTINQLLRFENHFHTLSFFGLTQQGHPVMYPWIVLIAVLGLLFGKMLATSLTLGSGGAGGTIVPSLFLGASLGAFVGHLATIFFPEANVSVGAFALIGMGSIIAGTSQAPLMAILLFFETTRSYQIILPVAIVSIISSQIVKYHLHGSMYTLDLKQMGISLYEGMEKTVMSTIRVGDIMRKNLLTVRDNMPLRQIMEIFLHTRFTTVIVININGDMLGKLHLDDLKRLVETPYLYNVLIASEIMEDVESLGEDEALTRAVDILSTKHSSLIPVVQGKQSHKPVGYITRKDVLNVYQKEILRKNISGMTFRSPVAGISDNIRQTRKAIDFSEDYNLETIAAPLTMLGKSLLELNFRQKFGITVLAILQGQGDNHIVPSPDYKIQKGDMLVIAGRKIDVEKLMHT